MSKFQTFLNKPSQTLNDAQATTKPAFKLKDASVLGGDMLISDPRKWSELEDEGNWGQSKIIGKLGSE